MLLVLMLLVLCSVVVPHSTHTPNSHNIADILIHTTLICGHTYLIVHFKLTLHPSIRSSVHPSTALPHFCVSFILHLSFYSLSPLRSLVIYSRHLNRGPCIIFAHRIYKTTKFYALLCNFITISARFN